MMTGLIHLEVPDMEIKSLEGLEYAENLEYLDASGNSIQSLEPIRDLRNVLTLDVSSNQLRDIQALHGFRQLKKLNISRNNLYTMDISSIAGMLHLEVLDLKRAKIDSLEYIIHCKKLQQLNINTENGPFNYSLLGTLKDLKKLDMSGMRRFNIDDLTYLSHLESLNLATNLMSDISPLLAMKDLKELNVSNCPYLKDYTILEQFPSLRKLNMNYNTPDSFDFLKNLPKMEELSMEQTGFHDLPLLNHMKKLCALNVSKNDLHASTSFTT